MKRGTVLPLVAGVAAVGLVIGFTAVRDGGDDTRESGSSDGGLPVLSIGSYAFAAADGAGPGGGFVLRGDLPTGPDRSDVYDLGRVDDGAEWAKVLAGALGLDAAVVSDDDGWTVTDGKAVLRVYDQPGTPWSFVREPDAGVCPSIPVTGYSAGSAVGCAVDWVQGMKTPSDAAVRDASVALLTALGLADTPAVFADSYGPIGSLRVSPVVDGMQTSGSDVEVYVRDGAVAGAAGYLAVTDGALDSRGAYPLRSAADAFAALQDAPRPDIACVDVADCPFDKQQVVTGGQLGLMTAWEGDLPLLVPAWFLTVEGSAYPQVLVAVDGRYLGEPDSGDDPVTSDPGSSDPGATEPGSSGSGGGSSGSGSSEPDPGVDEPVPAPDDPLPPDNGGAVDPGPDKPDDDVKVPPDPTQEPYSGIDSVEVDGTTMTIHVWGGACDVLTPKVVTWDVKTVVVEPGARMVGEACTDQLVLNTTTLELPGPLEGRQVLDVNGNAVKVSDVH